MLISPKEEMSGKEMGWESGDLDSDSASGTY